MSRILIIACAVSLLIVASLGGYYLWLKQPDLIKKMPLAKTAQSSPATSATVQNLKGFTKAQEYLSNNKGFISKSKVTITLIGKLLEVNLDKSWTIEKEGKRLTITKEDKGELSYFETSRGSKVAPIRITSGDIKIGDEVLIVVNIDSSSGDLGISAVSKLTP